MPDAKGWRPFRLEIRGTLRTAAPLHIGAGRGTKFGLDAPVLRDSNDEPYIPGSSLRGVWRHWLEGERRLLGCSQQCFNGLFGRTPGPKTRDEDKPKETVLGRLTVEPAYFEDLSPKDPAQSELRDHLRQDRTTGSGAEGAKFDTEVVPENVAFNLRMAYEGDASDDRELVLLGEMLRLLESGEMHAGAKAGWGHGALTLENPEYRVFQRDQPEDLAKWFGERLAGEKWLSGLPELPRAKPGTVHQDVEQEEDAPAAGPVSVLTFRLQLQFEGPVLVRSSVPSDAETVDAVFITTGPGGRKYLPGSSLRGVLRSRAEWILGRSAGVETLFGPYLHEQSEDAQSKARHGTIEISDGTLIGADRPVVIDHVGIDRILSGAKDGAKFNAMPLDSPRFEVTIRVRLRKDPRGEREQFDALPVWGLLLRDLLNKQGEIWVGAGVSRGYGYLHHGEVKSAELNLVDEHAQGLHFAAQHTIAARSGRKILTFREPGFAAFAPVWTLAGGQTA